MAEKTRKFHLSRDDRIIAGVCGGIAEYFSMDPLLVRLITVVAAVFSHGFVFLLYIIIAVVAEPPPHRGNQENTQHTEHASPVRPGLKFDFWTIVAIALVVLGALSLLGEFFPMGWLRWDLIWPLLLIGIGCAIITRRK